jgi:hypothetical protein
MKAPPMSAEALDLLDVARDTLRDELLTLIPAHGRHTALMLVNALGVVSRDLLGSEHALQGEARRLRELLATEPTDSQAPLDTQVQALRQRMVHAIRSGQFDQTPHALRLFAALCDTTVERCRIDAPKALGARLAS